MRLAVLAGTACWAVLLYGIEVHAKCGHLIKQITFEGENRTGDRIPYMENLAYKDFSPYVYLDGFNGDENTRGTTNERAWEVPAADASSLALEVLLPEGCVTGSCAMQAKSMLLLPTDSATLKFKMKFGPEFDWVRGGKLPGLCGAECLTGCKEVSGLDGFSSRHMWRPCVWPPEHADNEINCKGGKLVSYVNHMFKHHWCGDDFEFSNDVWSRTYKTARQPEVPKNFFQPKQDEWYTIWSHIEMNSAGPPDKRIDRTDVPRDGVLQTWLLGPDLPEPLLVVDKQDVAWRVYNNVSIDTLYFSVFFGGSSPSFQAAKDETIRFDDFQVWEGRCPPEDEPFSQILTKPSPVWDTLRHDRTGDTVLNVSTVFKSASTGGGCAKCEVENLSSASCDVYEVELNIRPSWGTLSERDGNPLVHGIKLLDIDEDAGWFLLQSDNRTIAGGETVRRAGACVKNYQGAKYLPDDLGSHVTAIAVCVAGPAATHPQSTKSPIFDPFSYDGGTGDGKRWAKNLLIALGILMTTTFAILAYVVLTKRRRNVRLSLNAPETS